ncbi:unnamed protein product [Closterium sp. NIES-64]|nr:unnamed protein product [Closterium sp. NIES-64]
MDIGHGLGACQLVVRHGEEEEEWGGGEAWEEGVWGGGGMGRKGYGEEGVWGGGVRGEEGMGRRRHGEADV